MKTTRYRKSVQSPLRAAIGDLPMSSYKIGDSFLSLPLPQVQELLAESIARIDENVSSLQEKLGGIRGEMEELKVALYARFGRSINLER